MNSFLEEHQKILNSLLKKEGEMTEKLEKQMKEFLIRIDATVEVYNLLTNRVSAQLKRLNDEAEELCAMRNLIQEQRARNRELEKNAVE